MKPLQISNAKPKEKIYKLKDGSGLFFRVYPNNWRQWIFIFSWNGKQKSMGLGGYPTVSLAEAREQASEARKVVRSGFNPIEQRRLLFASQNQTPTLTEILKQTFEAQKPSLVPNAKGQYTWDRPLQVHIIPKIGNMKIIDIRSDHIENAFKPIWHIKADTANKCLQRLRICFNYASARNLDVKLDQIDKAKNLLGKQTHVSKPQPSLNWREVPQFYKILADNIISNLALKLIVLTGLRTRPICHANIKWIDNNVMTIPAEFMKGTLIAKEAFKVPLCAEAINVIKKCPISSEGVIFRGSGKNKYISDTTMSKFMIENGYRGKAVPHGFRSTFRTWLDDCTTDVDWAIKEAAIAHKVGNKTTQSYARSDFLEQRKELHERYSWHVLGKETAKVITLQRSV